MSTDIIFKKLAERAEDKLRKALRSAADNYNRALNLSGTGSEITLKDRNGVEIKIYTSDIYEAITQTLFEKRREDCVKAEVSNFLESVSSLSEQFKLLEELDLEN